MDSTPNASQTNLPTSVPAQEVPRSDIPPASGSKLKRWMFRVRDYFKNLKRPQKLALAFVCIAVLLAAGWMLLPRSKDGFSDLLIDPAYAQDNFEVTATQADSIGVEGGTAFLIKSKTEIADMDVLKKSIMLEPAMSFNLEKIDKQNFKVVPQSPLQGRQVYNLAIESAYVGEDGVKQERDYSWAFQVKDTFKVAQTLPRNETTYIPLDTGIEITFSQDNFKNYEDKVKIEPETKGKFEKHNRTLVFVPESLAAGTLYTVTVSKDMELEGSDNRLSEDFVFRFETDATGAKRGEYQSLEFEKYFNEFSTVTKPVFGLYSSGNTAQSVGVKVFGFTGEDKFAGAVTERAAVPDWASYSRATYLRETASLTKVSEYNLPVSSYSSYQQFFSLPDVLPQGYYLVEMTWGNMTRQAFFQVNDLSVYTSVTNSDTLVWVHNLQNKEPVKAASVENADGSFKVETDESGLATFRTDTTFALKAGERKSTLVKVRSGGFTSIVPLDITYGEVYDDPSANDYWYYFYTDRSLYKPTDTVNLWGYLKARSGELASQEVTVRLIRNDSYDYYYDPIVISETKAQVKDGAVSGQLPLQNVTPGYYSLEFKSGDTTINTQYIEIQAYTKPAYDISATSEKKAIFAGENIVVKTAASFFEGTPVADMNLGYTAYGGVQGEVKTDAAGSATITIPTIYNDCSRQEYCYYPDGNDIQVHPTQGEEGEISADASVRVFGPHVAVRGDFVQVNDTLARITARVNGVDVDKINSGRETSYDDYYGAAVQGIKVHAELKEIIYTKEVMGEYYDFINKIVRKQYNYVTSEKALGTYDAVTDAEGKNVYELPIKLDRSYKVKLFVDDGTGRTAVTTEYLYTFNDEDYDYNYYNLVFKTATGEEGEPEFSVGDKVEVKFMNGEKQLDASSKNDFLYYRLQDGIISHELSSQPTYGFTFEEQYIPGVYLEGVWFDGNSYHESKTSTWWRGSDALFVGFKRSDRKLNIQVTADKGKYKPGEEVVLKAKATKDDGSAVRTSLNLNLVDEAFYALSGESADTLNGFYGNPMSSGKLAYYSTHELPVGAPTAEGGGCFTAKTEVLMADGAQKDIKDVKVGDEILTFENEFTKKLVSARVAETFRHEVGGYLVINGELEVTPEHRVFVNNGWQMIGEAKLGDILVGADGERITIRTIERVRKIVPVYNLRIEKYSTFIADGIYVHNDKDGGRQLFVDNALFASVATDANGEAEVRFTLPDNITSWRVTAQGISDDLFAGTGASSVLVSLPAFVTTTFADQYLSSDKPTIKVNSFGTALQSGDEVSYQLDAPSLGLNNYVRTGKAFTAEYVDLSALSAGTHKITASLQAGENTDKLTRSITVSDSRLVAAKQKYYDLAPELKIEGNPTGRTEIMFTDKERGRFYSQLSELAWTPGDRVDQKLSRVLSTDLKKKYFGEDIQTENFDGKIYQLEDGSISLLPYSDADLSLSVQIAALAPAYFDEESLKNYFYTVYNSQTSTGEEVGLSLWGLAALGEPVLIPIQHFATLADLSVKARLYGALAANNLGDKESARRIYIDLLEKNGENFDYYVRLKSGEDDSVNLQITALAAILAGGLDDPYRDRLWNYVNDRYSNEVLTNLEKLLYISKSLPTLRAGASGFTLQVAGRTEQIKIENGGHHKISVTPEELGQIKFSDLQGSIGVVSFFTQAVTEGNRGIVNPALSVQRQYFVNGTPATTFAENSLVEVHLNLGIQNDLPGEDYQVTDLLPSGLKIVTNPYLRGRSYDYCVRYPYEVDGQSVKFYVGKSWLNSPQNSCGGFYKYYARVISPGTYTAEPALIESLRGSDIKNYSASDQITISKPDGV